MMYDWRLKIKHPPETLVNEVEDIHGDQYRFEIAGFFCLNAFYDKADYYECQDNVDQVAPREWDA